MSSRSAFASGFNSQNFRDAIISTMQMGEAQDPAQRATFHFRPEREYSSADNAGNPYDLTSTPINESTKADVQVECAIEFVPRSTMSGGTAVGQFETPRAVISLLDPEYQQIKDATEVSLGEDLYEIDFVEPPVSLFDQTLFRLHCHAVSES